MAGDETEPLGVTISTREIYDQIVGTRADVQQLTHMSAQVTQQVADHEERIRSIERWRYSVPAALVATVASAVVALIK